MAQAEGLAGVSSVSCFVDSVWTLSCPEAKGCSQSLSQAPLQPPQPPACPLPPLGSDLVGLASQGPWPPQEGPAVPWGQGWVSSCLCCWGRGRLQGKSPPWEHFAGGRLAATLHTNPEGPRPQAAAPVCTAFPGAWRSPLSLCPSACALRGLSPPGGHRRGPHHSHWPLLWAEGPAVGSPGWKLSAPERHLPGLGLCWAGGRWAAKAACPGLVAAALGPPGQGRGPSCTPPAPVCSVSAPRRLNPF